jgi:hypothetical protein
MEVQTMKAQKIEAQHTTNGVDVGELFSTIDAVKKSPVFDSITKGVPVSVKLDR